MGVWLTCPALQIQTRDLPGFVETRNQLLVLKPGQRTNWISFAVAHHANKSYDVAVQVLSASKQSALSLDCRRMDG
jgi:peptide alpha-N-acetyltransferase